MKIATFNINNVNKRLANLLAWLERGQAGRRLPAGAEVDGRATFRTTAIEKAGYGAVWRGQKSWNGVAILARGCEPVVTRTELPGDPADTQSRYIEAAVNGVLIGCALCAERQSAARPEIRLQARVDRAARRARGRALRGRTCRSCSPATTTSCRPTATSTRPSPTRRTRCVQPESRARCSGSFSSRAGPTPSARCIPTRRCTRSGTTCGTAGRATPGCGSTICC